ncbi:hypothetical protein AK830_g8298 [Neonectria ditissima]|uniref:Laccase-1 n=1 Tax=Neonectria ditissima TaxID=78410 RepID=A0A0P7AKQ7_9HYPO|nr:hypothetical protein AK830_g8298 [Neonectria ditissima]
MPVATMDQGSDHATRSSSIEDDRLLEQQPFLEAHEETSNVEKTPPKRQQLCSHLQTTLLAIFIIISVLAISSLTLESQHTPKSKAHSNGQGDHPQPRPSATGDVIQYNEDITETPRLRDAEEYILSPSWDFSAPPTTREYNWTIVSATLNPDGVFRPMVLINNQYPGPLIECNEGDTIVVHVNNQAINATAIHFHGMFQNGTNAMDGTVGITQCAIAPNSSFTYRFDVKGQSGTYWYHAHHSVQASDGLLGPMVVHSQHERRLQELEYATDRVVMVQDHYHNLTSDLLMEYLAPDQENDEPVPDNALINGRGVRDCADFDGWPCDSTNRSTPTFDLAAGKRHRLRIINVGAFAEFQIQFDEHPFYVTEVDGTDVHPEPFHRLNILPAQRYSVVIETNVTSASTFWMRSRMVTHCFTRPNEHLQPEIRAIIRYTSAESEPSVDEPTSREWPEAIEVICRDLNTSLLHPVEAVTPPPADDFVILRANFEIGAWRLARGFFNDSSWHANATHPSLHRFLDSNTTISTLESPVGINELAFDRKTELVLQTTGIRTVDISINNFDDGAHPFHLHGHNFFVLVQGRSGYPPTAAELPQYLEEHNLLENPLRRDTITVEGYAWAIIRVVFDNPGLWAFHCHNTWHAESGMLMQILIRSEVVREWEVDPQQREMCEREGVGSGMRPDNSLWFGQFR